MQPEHSFLLPSPRKDERSASSSFLSNAQRVSISIEDFSLEINKEHGGMGILSLLAHKCQEKILFGGRGGNTEKKSMVLQHIGATMRAGRLIAVMGHSGCGKTSLLNAIAGRITEDSGVSISGEIFFNGTPLNAQIIENSVGYVLQGDFFSPNLTVRETLQCSAMLRLPSLYSAEEKLKTVEDVIRELGLTHCADTYMGDERHRGISGGEKRRVSIGMQMLTNPSVLLLDEPTSGLDSFMAHTVMETLQKLAKQGRTVICSIHQPRSDIFHMFDDLMLLSKGETVYFGRSLDVVGYFARAGHKCPGNMNPADFILDIASIDMRNPDTERDSRVRVDKLINFYKSSRNSSDLEGFEATNVSTRVHSDFAQLQHHHQFKKKNLRKHKRDVADAHTQLRVLVVRSARNLYRDRTAVSTSLATSILLSVLLGMVFYKVDDTLEGIKERMAALYALISLQSYTIMTYTTYRLCQDLPVFDRERQDNLFRILPYFLATNIASLLLDIICPVLFSIISYWIVGFRDTSASFMVFSASFIVCHYCSISWAWLAASAFRSFAWASLFANALSIMFSMSCGFLVNPTTYPSVIRWIKYIDPLKWAYETTLINEFGNRQFPCPDQNADDCIIYDGNYNLKTQGIEDQNLTIRFLILVCLTVIFRLAALGILYAIPRKPTMSKSPSQSAPPPALPRHYNTFTDNLPHFAAPFKIEMKDIGVSVTSNKHTIQGSDEKQLPAHSSSKLQAFADIISKLMLSRKHSSQISILKNISGVFRTGQLVVLMGGSGSGKTTLLNMLAGRLQGGQTTGEIFVNDVISTPQIREGLTSYVLQNDHLYPHLTVRETLQYAALLRLPATFTNNDKLLRVNEIIAELGLKDCADTLIGDESSRGISGGEKRRVTIGLQMLTDPSILLLDEPTSGLDSFTVYNIIEMLKKIARSGRLVVCSIHQPRSDIFHLFDKVVLLTRGELAFCGDRTNVLEYFSRIGFQCPNETNPADFLLDITSIDGRSGEKLIETTATVSHITNKWACAQQLEDTSANVASHGYSTSSADGDVILGDTSSLKNKDSTVADSAIITNEHESMDNFLDVGNLPLLQPEFQPKSSSHVVSISQLSTMKAMRPFYVTMPVLLRRTFTNMARTPLSILARVMQAIAFACIMIIYYAPMGDDETSIQNRIGFLYMATSSICLGMINSSSFFPPERNMFYREAADGSHGSIPFYLTYLISELPYDVFMAITVTSMMFFGIGLEFSPAKFCMFAVVMFCLIFAGESTGAAIGVGIYDVGFATALTSALLTFLNTMGGFLSIGLHPSVAWINKFSLNYYASLVLAVDHFSGLTFTCSNQEACPIRTGDEVLALYNFDVDKKWDSVFWIIGLTIAYRAIGALVLTTQKKRYAQ